MDGSSSRRTPHQKTFNERRAVIASKAVVFALTSQDLPGEQMAAIFVKHLRRMSSLVRSRRPPFWAMLTKDKVTPQEVAAGDNEERSEKYPEQRPRIAPVTDVRGMNRTALEVTPYGTRRVYQREDQLGFAVMAQARF